MFRRIELTCPVFSRSRLSYHGHDRFVSGSHQIQRQARFHVTALNDQTIRCPGLIWRHRHGLRSHTATLSHRKKSQYGHARHGHVFWAGTDVFWISSPPMLSDTVAAFVQYCQSSPGAHLRDEETCRMRARSEVNHIIGPIPGPIGPSPGGIGPGVMGPHGPAGPMPGGIIP